MGYMLITLAFGLVLETIFSLAFKKKFFSLIWITIVAFLVGVLAGHVAKGDYYESEDPEIVRIAGIEYLDVETKDGAKYLSRGSDNTFTYLRERIDINGKVRWEPAKIPTGTTFIIVEREEYLEPVLCIYSRGYKKNFWTYSLGNTHFDYVFRLPISDTLPYTNTVIETPNEDENLPQIEQDPEVYAELLPEDE